MVECVRSKNISELLTAMKLPALGCFNSMIERKQDKLETASYIKTSYQAVHLSIELRDSAYSVVKVHVCKNT
jgi:hypothetical protein